jgi:hypothetical protein
VHSGVVLPRWVPTDLIELAKDPASLKVRRKRACLNASERLHLLQKLMMDERMRSVWTTLQRRKIGTDPDSGDALLGARLFWTCERLLAEWNRLPKESPSQQEARHRLLAKSASQLADKIKSNYCFRALNIVDLLNDHEIELIKDALSSDVDANVSPRSFRYEVKILSSSWPSVVEALKRIEALAIRAANRPPRIPQPNSPRARAYYFARGLAQLFLANTGKPMFRTVADITNVVFDLEFSEDNVRALLATVSKGRSRKP